MTQARDPWARRPRVIIVSGPSGAGKGTLIGEVMDRIPDLEIAVSATTRQMRPGEQHGIDYYFLEPAEFLARVKGGDFLEHVTYAGNHYGTLRSEVDRLLESGTSVILEIELRGARAVRRALPDAVAVFITPPSMEELERRLVARATDSPSDIQARLETGLTELDAIDEFDHVVVNEEVETAARDLERIIDEATRLPDA